MTNIRSGLLEFVEVVLKEVNIAFVIINQKAENIEIANNTLQLGFFIRG